MQLKKSKDYVVTFRLEHVAFVDHDKYSLAQRRVDTSPANRLCSTWKQQKLPCRYLLAMLTTHDVKDSAFQFFGDCYKVDTFVTSVGKIVIPKDLQLARDTAIKPAATVRQAGRSRKRRVRSRGETGGTAGERTSVQMRQNQPQPGYMPCHRAVKGDKKR